MHEQLSYKKLVNGDFPPWVRRYIKQTGKTINSFEMIKDEETILLSVSGGKDSLALALALSIRRKWIPIYYNLKAVMINWVEHPISEQAKTELYAFFKALDIDFTIFDEIQYSSSFKGEFNCYLCSRNRRRILFDYAKDNNLKIIALGHHLDDLVETTLINTCFRGNFSTMLPVQEFFNSSLFIIRPMIEVHESVLKRLAYHYDLPVVKPVCPYDESNIRSKLKPIVSSLSKIDKQTREHMFKSHKFTEKIIRN